jgi:hypothetical protein
VGAGTHVFVAGGVVVYPRVLIETEHIEVVHWHADGGRVMHGSQAVPFRQGGQVGHGEGHLVHGVMVG